MDRLLSDSPGEPIDLTGATYAPSVGHRHIDAAPSAEAGLRLIRAGVPNMPAWTLVDGRVAYVLRAPPGSRTGRAGRPSRSPTAPSPSTSCGQSADVITISFPARTARNEPVGSRAVDPSPILVVEDDDLVRSFLCRALTGVAGDVDACATGAEAMRAVDHRRYGAILLDGLLPDTHGVELARKLIAHPNASRQRDLLRQRLAAPPAGDARRGQRAAQTAAPARAARRGRPAADLVAGRRRATRRRRACRARHPGRRPPGALTGWPRWSCRRSPSCPGPWATTASWPRPRAVTGEGACCLFVIDEAIPASARSGYAALVIAYARANEPVTILEGGAAALLIRDGGVASGAGGGAPPAPADEPPRPAGDAARRRAPRSRDGVDDALARARELASGASAGEVAVA